jgi:tmRNA-binding protein
MGAEIYGMAEGKQEEDRREEVHKEEDRKEEAMGQ